eukprot:TRINITY_DN9836_c0_g1_i1.p1 TRINITY_DN9836_c0_g1~~TRINITY_DN9836_c0_g1_i1.p1  ORF type:complete len:160 (-),score=51.76 TRINITY_DN9836_c0_g1_i1:16-495(-)
MIAIEHKPDEERENTRVMINPGCNYAIQRGDFAFALGLDLLQVHQIVLDIQTGEALPPKYKSNTNPSPASSSSSSSSKNGRQSTKSPNSDDGDGELEEEQVDGSAANPELLTVDAGTPKLRKSKSSSSTSSNSSTGSVKDKAKKIFSGGHNSNCFIVIR